MAEQAAAKSVAEQGGEIKQQTTEIGQGTEGGASAKDIDTAAAVVGTGAAVKAAQKVESLTQDAGAEQSQLSTQASQLEGTVAQTTEATTQVGTCRYDISGSVVHCRLGTCCLRDSHEAINKQVSVQVQEQAAVLETPPPKNTAAISSEYVTQCQLELTPRADLLCFSHPVQGSC